MSGGRNCAVTLTDDEGIKHSTTVVGSSLYEVAALAIREFRRNPWMAEQLRRSTRLDVEVLQPSEQHSLSIDQLVSWSRRPPRSPQEKIIKTRIGDLLKDVIPAVRSR